MDKIFANELRWYQVRLHNLCDKYVLEDIHKHFSENVACISFIIAKETEAARPHFQICLGMVKTFTKKALQEFIKITYKYNNDGNSNFSVSAMRKTITDLKRYMIKEGDFTFYGIDPKEIANFKLLAFKDPKKHMKDFLKIDDEFLTSEMKEVEYIHKVRQLKRDLRQPYNDMTMYKRLQMLADRRDEGRGRKSDRNAFEFYKSFLGTEYQN